MDSTKEFVSQNKLLTLIEDYIKKTSGLKVEKDSSNNLKVLQKIDSKEICIARENLADVIFRKDTKSNDFIQVNFMDGQRVLLTDQLIGFKPQAVPNLDLSKLPKVVTTIDLFAVLEAIEETSSDAEAKYNTDLLKNIFQSILLGGEKIGFDLTPEKTWLRRIPALGTKIVS